VGVRKAWAGCVYRAAERSELWRGCECVAWGQGCGGRLLHRVGELWCGVVRSLAATMKTHGWLGGHDIGELAG